MPEEPPSTDADPYPTLREFWPYYLSEHLDPANRALHVIGSLCGVMWLVLAAAWLQPWLILAAFVNGYAFAWIGHFLIERNRPATFKYPLKSFVCDWILLGYTLTGRIGRELRALQSAGIEIPEEEPASSDLSGVGS